MKLLFVGDVVGGCGRRALLSLLPALRDQHQPDFVVVNGENAAGGLGITPKIADELLDAGVDAITLGNHAYRHQRGLRVPRPRAADRPPGELPEGQPGPRATRSWRATACGSGWSTSPAPSSWTPPARRSRRSTRSWPSCAARPTHVLVDFHAEATSEKVAMGWHLDGRVTACVGTHTHVPTADARVLPGGTAYISDVGMTGPRGGVIGVKREQALERFRTMMPVQVRDLRRGPVAQRGAGDGARGRPGGVDRAGAAAGLKRPEGEGHARAAAGASRSRHERERERLAVHQVEVARGELHQRQHGGRARRAAASACRRQASASAPSGIVQTRNCGDSTLPRAAKAATAPSEASTSRRSSGAPARRRERERGDRREQRAPRRRPPARPPAGWSSAVGAEGVHAARPRRRPAPSSGEQHERRAGSRPAAGGPGGTRTSRRSPPGESASPAPAASASDGARARRGPASAAAALAPRQEPGERRRHGHQREELDGGPEPEQREARARARASRGRAARRR